MKAPVSFKFSLVDTNGDPIPDSGWKGSLGMGAKYSGTTSDTDALIQTIAAAYEGTCWPMSRRESENAVLGLRQKRCLRSLPRD